MQNKAAFILAVLSLVVAGTFLHAQPVLAQAGIVRFATTAAGGTVSSVTCSIRSVVGQSFADRVVSSQFEIRCGFLFGGTVPTSVPEDDPRPPLVTQLRDPRPNPFNPAVNIAFDLASESPVSVTIHDVAGRRVVDLVQGFRSAGSHEVVWHGRDNRGRTVAAGIYFVTLQTAHVRQQQKITLLK